MFRYETHMHTAPVSRCGRAEVRESLEFYRDLGYDGVFVTNHFLDGSINVDKQLPYEEQIDFYFSDYERARQIGRELGLRVFCGVEMTDTSNNGIDFLVYGLDKDWYLSHPEIMDMKKSRQLPFLMEQGALVIQAHPFREARYIDHIGLYPRAVHGVEEQNGCRTEFENGMARLYRRQYGLLPFAGSDNHNGPRHTKGLAGIETDSPILSERDFVERVLAGNYRLFSFSREET